MAFCPECGKSVTAEASKCASCGRALEAKPAAAKSGAGRFKGTMMMTPASAVAKPAAEKPAAETAAAAPLTTATAPAAPPTAAAPAVKSQAKATMIGTGLGAAAGGPAPNALKPATPGVLTGAAAAKPAAPLPAAPVARAAAPNVGGAAPKSTVLGAGIGPVAAAAAAHAAPAAAAPIAASAAGAAAQAIAARPGQVPAAKPDEAKRNLAYAQTQHHGAFVASSQAAKPAVAAAAVPRTSPDLSPARAAVDTFDAHAETDPPDPIPPADNPTSELRESDLEPARDPKYLPGDPMGPQVQPVAARAPMLRYDDSIPKFSRGGTNEKKWLWITAGVIVVACLGLVFVLASRMGH
jgi:hypothetical protein